MGSNRGNAVEYDFTAPTSNRETKMNALSAVDGINEIEGMKALEKNPRLYATVVGIMGEIDRLNKAEELTRQHAEKHAKGTALKNAEHFVEKISVVSKVASIASMIDRYNRGEFIIE